MSASEIDTNRDSWDQRTGEHVGSRFYDVDGFLAGRSSLNPLEVQLVGTVAGLSLLHLQCHFGLDSLSWARLGAQVTGLDFSPVAIDQARTLARRSGVAADFVCAEVYAAGDHLSQRYDRVYSSYGVLEWLPDMQRWAAVVAAALRPGGVLDLIEFHPYSYALDGHPYFNNGQSQPLREVSYTENAQAELPLHVWSHPVSDVINALLGAGLQLQQFNEYPYSPYNCFAGLVEREPGRYYRADGVNPVPMLYSIKAIKPMEATCV